MTRLEFINEGYPSKLATALEGREITLDNANAMQPQELLNEYLEWNGIIGYSHSIWELCQWLQENVG